MYILSYNRDKVLDSSARGSAGKLSGNPAKFHAMENWQDGPNKYEKMIFQKWVFLVRKSFPDPVGAFCTLLEVPNCHIAEKIVCLCFLYFLPISPIAPLKGPIGSWGACETWQETPHTGGPWLESAGALPGIPVLHDIMHLHILLTLCRYTS